MQTGSYISNMLPVLVGGLIAVLSAAATQYIIHKLKSVHEKKLFMRDKLEKLVSYAYECQNWLDLIKIKYMVKGENESIVSDFPLSKMRMLQSLYFNDLKNEVDNVINAVEIFQTLIIVDGRSMVRATGIIDEKFGTKYDANQKMLNDALHSLVEKATKLNT